MKITKKDIEQMVKDIYAFCKKEDIGKYEFILFYNGCRYGNVSKNWKKPRLGKINNQDPHDWCEYYSENNIIAIACDGGMYDLLNGDYGYSLYEKFEDIFKKYNCYLECCDSCHYDVVYLGDDEDVEYTVWKKEEIIYLYTADSAPDTYVQNIMIAWMEMSKEVGDIGGCVMGAYMEFKYKDKKYRMSPQSPYQGSVSWEMPLETVKKMLKNIGASEIHFNYGRLD